MKFPDSNGNISSGSRDGGVALVLTLLILSMLVVVVVGFVSVSRLEQIAARNATYQSAAEQMAQLATGQAVERLRTAVQAGVTAGAYATQSGRLYPVGQDQSQALFSQGGNNTNINASTSYGWVTGTAGDNISVGLPNAPAVAGQVTGRTGFYIADETAKLPINFASPGRPALNPALPRPFSLKGVDATLQSGGLTTFSNILSGTFSNNSISNWSYFFTPEQVALAISNIGEVRSRRVTVATATNQPPPFAKPKTPWGTDRILLNQVALSDASVADLTNAMTDPKLKSIFGSHFADKYGEAGLRQLAANLIQLRSDHWEPTRMFIGTNPIVGTVTNAVAAPAPTSGDLKKTNGVPDKFFGYVPFPMLKEINVSYAYGWMNAGVMTVRVFLECLLYNPYPVAFGGGGGVFAQIDKAFFTVYYNDPALDVDFQARRRGPEGTPNSQTDFPYNFSDVSEMDPWGIGAGRYDSLEPASGIQIVAIPTIPAGGEVAVPLSFDLNFLETNPNAVADGLPSFFSRFIFDQVKLLANTNDPTSVRDWISGYDLFNALSDGTSAAEFTVAPPGSPSGTADGGGPELTFIDAVPPETKLVKRFDPRLRLPLDAAKPYQTNWPGKIWFEVPYADAVAYTPGTGPNPSVPADPAFAGDPAKAIYNPDIPPRLAFSSSSTTIGESPVLVWSMPADLGKVFTGVPWRTLRMQPQLAAETGIPDWVLLDMVDFTDGTKPLTTVNPNSGYASPGATVPGFGAGLRSQLDVLTNATARTNVANPLVPTETVPNPAKLAGLTNNLSISNLVTQAANLQWSPQGGWGGKRQARKFPSTALLLPSEIVEIAGFADYAGQGDNFKLNEYRIGTLFPGLSTKSRFFKIYAVGEAFEGTTQNVAATALLQTLVEVNDSTTPPTVTTIYQYPPAD